MKFRGLRNSLTVWSLSALLILGIGAFAGFPGTASAQVGTSINGTVRDTSGAVIPDAKVVLHNPATKLDLVTTTNSAGALRLSRLSSRERMRFEFRSKASTRPSNRT